VTCADGAFKVVQGLAMNAFAQSMLDRTVKELVEERAAVQSVLQ
jgi:malate dehydrogenase